MGAALCVLLGMGAAQAQLVPGSADSSRIVPQVVPSAGLGAGDSAAPVATSTPALEAPQGAEKLNFTLRALTIEGAAAYSEAELRALYADKIDQPITLADIYAIANTLHQRYQADGYFLTRVTVPNQRIASGSVTIRVVEGYIDDVVLNDPLAEHFVVRGYLARITEEKPLKAKTLERVLLSLNDLPGQNFRAVLSASPNGQEGASQLTLLPSKNAPTASLGFDNFGSRFLGPNQVNATVSGSLLPLQQTTLYGLAAVPTRELGYGVLRHSLQLAPDLIVQAEAGFTRARPGFVLEPLEIDSRSTNIDLSLRYQWLRSRDQNLSTSLSLAGRRIRSDISDTTLTREDVRVARLNAAYDVRDVLKGSNVINLTLSQGLDGLGASDSGDLNLSRASAKPDFTKAELFLARLQELDADWSLLAQLSGQIASGSLYSSEEFGYGGQVFGRAFDASELVGDEGINGAIELRYAGLRAFQPVNFEPYIFYDFGVVTNKNLGQSKRDTATSAGGGIRFASGYGQAGNFGFAIPLTRDALAPIYGANPGSPRLVLQITQGF